MFLPNTYLIVVIFQPTEFFPFAVALFYLSEMCNHGFIFITDSNR